VLSVRLNKTNVHKRWCFSHWISFESPKYLRMSQLHLAVETCLPSISFCLWQRKFSVAWLVSAHFLELIKNVRYRKNTNKFRKVIFFLFLGSFRPSRDGGRGHCLQLLRGMNEEWFYLRRMDYFSSGFPENSGKHLRKFYAV